MTRETDKKYVMRGRMKTYKKDDGWFAGLARLNSGKNGMDILSLFISNSEE